MKYSATGNDHLAANGSISSGKSANVALLLRSVCNFLDSRLDHVVILESLAGILSEITMLTTDSGYHAAVRLELSRAGLLRDEES